MKFLYFIVLWAMVGTDYTLRSPYKKMFGLATRGLPMTILSPPRRAKDLVNDNPAEQW